MARPDTAEASRFLCLKVSIYEIEGVPVVRYSSCPFSERLRIWRVAVASEQWWRAMASIKISNLSVTLCSVVRDVRCESARMHWLPILV